MTQLAVHWHEGMFLRPQHFQAATRYLLDQHRLGGKWDSHYNWGLRSIDLDADALANYRFVVRGLQARLRDGTLVCVPEDGALPPVDLRPVLDTLEAVTVSLAAPVLQPGRANVTPDGGGDGFRWHVETQELEDENTGLNPRPIRFRALNLRMTTAAELSGHELLPIARIQRSTRADSVPELQTAYIPPVLGCDAWPVLHNDILETVYNRIGRVLKETANRVRRGGISFESATAGDVQLFEQLRTLNEAYAALGVLTFSQGTHPFEVFVELARTVGKLAIFASARELPDLPTYDHDDLARFWELKRLIDSLLEGQGESGYHERPFVGAGRRMQVALEPSWLEPAWQMFVGVKTPLAIDEAVRLLTRAGQLDMKIGSSDRVDEIFQFGLAGLRFAHAPTPPRALPSGPGMVYLQVNRESQPEEWDNVRRSLTVAIRLNERYLAGNIDGQKSLTIKLSGGQTTGMTFTLYVAPREAAVPKA